MKGKCIRLSPKGQVPHVALPNGRTVCEKGFKTTVEEGFLHKNLSVTPRLPSLFEKSIRGFVTKPFGESIQQTYEAFCVIGRTEGKEYRGVPFTGKFPAKIVFGETGNPVKGPEKQVLSIERFRMFLHGSFPPYFYYTLYFGKKRKISYFPARSLGYESK